MPRKTEYPAPAVPVAFHTLFLFLFLCAVNALLAYGPWGLETKLWIGLAGLGLPFLTVWSGSRPAGPNGFPFLQKEIFPSIPSFFFLLAFLLAIALRFAWIWARSPWPMWDDGEYSSFAVSLSERWHWRIFFGPEQYLPAYTWLQGLFYKAMEPSLFSLRLFLFLVSILPLPAVYLALRRQFSGTFVFLYLCLWSFGFWPIFLTRFSTDVGLELLGQYIAGGLFLAFLRSTRKPGGACVVGAGALGFAAGAGWYLSKFWIPNIPLFLGLGFLALFQSKVKSLRTGLALGAGFLAAVLPLAFAMVSLHYGAHLQTTLSMSHDWARQLRVSLPYFSALFWGMPSETYFTFGPLWGGFLNPLSAAGFWLGALELAKEGRRKWGAIILVSFLVLFIPGALTNNIEMMRVAAVLPLVLGLVALGWGTVLSDLHPRFRVTAFLLILGLSLALDLFHLFGPFHDWAVPGKSGYGIVFQERSAAFQILQRTARREGPGLVFSEFIPDVYDQSLLTAAYPFNAARNPRLSGDQARWFGCLTRAEYGDYLCRRFPGGVAYPLPDSYDPADLFNRNFILFVAPISPGELSPLEAWRRADLFLSGLYPEIPYHLIHGDYGSLRRKLRAGEGLFKSDPYLESVYWWKQLLYSKGDPDSREMRDIVDALSPSTHPGRFWNPLRGAAYQCLGVSQVKEKSYAAALRSFRGAGRWDPSLTPPLAVVHLLTRLAKTRPLP